jgi:hypothetical protein
MKKIKIHVQDIIGWWDNIILNNLIVPKERRKAHRHHVQTFGENYLKELFVELSKL